MKKIATLTFHWATNYGAVLQAFALQRFLQKHRFETEIINYIPLKPKARSDIYSFLHGDFDKLKKEKRISRFRREQLVLSDKRYFSNKSLKKCSDKYSAVICGSDQIWNQSFTVEAGKKPVLSYFIDFAGDKTKRIAYAASFGAERMPGRYIEAVSGEIAKFKAISVRENSGIGIVDSMGGKAKLICDPTLLLCKTDYDGLLSGKDFKNCGSTGGVFAYLLHGVQPEGEKVSEYMKTVLGDNGGNDRNDLDVYEWLWRIKNSSAIVTNSFHGTVLSVIFEKPFISLLIPGSGMNDRIITFLSNIGLENHICSGFDRQRIDDVISEKTDWSSVNDRIAALREEGGNFLISNLSE